MFETDADGLPALLLSSPMTDAVGGERAPSVIGRGESVLRREDRDLLRLRFGKLQARACEHHLTFSARSPTTRVPRDQGYMTVDVPPFI